MSAPSPNYRGGDIGVTQPPCIVSSPRDLATPPPLTPNTEHLQSQPPSQHSSTNPSPSDPNQSSTFPPAGSLSSIPAHLSPAAPFTPAPQQQYRPSRSSGYSPGTGHYQSPSQSRASPSSPVRQPGSNPSLDIETVLKAAGGDFRLALDNLLNERNSFHAQNSQLWKVIDKQRTHATRLVAENDRLRSERDRASARLQASTTTISSMLNTTAREPIGLGLVSSPEIYEHGHVESLPSAPKHHSEQAKVPIRQGFGQIPSAKQALQALATGQDAPPSHSTRSMPTSLVPKKTPLTGPPQPSPSPPLDPALSSQHIQRRQQAESKLSFPHEVQKDMALAELANVDPVEPSQGSARSLAMSDDFASKSTDLDPPRTPALNEPSQHAASLPSLVPLSPFFTEASGSNSRRTPPTGAAQDSSEASATDSGSGPSLPHPFRSQRSTDSINSAQQSNAPILQRPTAGDAPPPYGVSLHSRQSRLIPALVPYARVTIPSSSIFPNSLGKDVLCFIVSIIVHPPNQSQPVTWSVGKLFSAFIELDATIKSRVGGGRRDMRNLGIEQLPEGRAWKDFAPSKIDQRKATLETYLQSLLKAPLADKGDLCEFLSTDQIAPGISSTGPLSCRKEGYLTKKGKNFGGWKTRYFVLHGPVMEYYESRGGTHLGTIPIVNAQIGRQNKDKPVEHADDNSYRHAFLIIEGRRPGNSSATRHVLCADSDEERDSWVEILVRYVTGEYNPPSPPPVDTVPEKTLLEASPMPRPSTSSNIGLEMNKRKPAIRNHSGEIVITRSSAQPLSTLPADAMNAKLFQRAPSPSIINAIETSGHHREVSTSSSVVPYDSRGASPHPSITSAQSTDIPLSNSLPGDSNAYLAQPVEEYDRPTSALGAAQPVSNGRKLKRQSVAPPARTERMVDRVARQSFAPSYLSRMTSPHGPEQHDASRLLTQKISAPSGGQPIPSGYKFGAKDVAEPADRDRKAKGGRFWGFGKNDRNAGGPLPPNRPVFGIPLTESVAVATVADLPAIVFRCIQYLEAKRAEEEEGIYRLSGSSAVIKGLRDRFNNEGDVDLLGLDEHWDPHAIAGLLKAYLRELPTSLLTRELHLHFIATMDLINPRERVSELSRLVSELPSSNYTLLRALTSHLILIVKNSAINKMTLRNIGIVFSPTLGIPAGIFSELVSHFTAVFDDELEDLRDTVEADAEVPMPRESTGGITTRRNRNSVLYQAAGAEALLGLGGRELDTQGEDSESDLGEFDPTLDSDADSNFNDPDATVRQVNPADYDEQAGESDASYKSRKARAFVHSRKLNVDPTLRTSDSAFATARAVAQTDTPQSPQLR